MQHNGDFLGAGGSRLNATELPIQGRIRGRYTVYLGLRGLLRACAEHLWKKAAAGPRIDIVNKRLVATGPTGDAAQRSDSRRALPSLPSSRLSSPRPFYGTTTRLRRPLGLRSFQGLPSHSRRRSSRSAAATSQ